MAATPGTFKEIFALLRDILRTESRGLTVSADKPTYFCLEIPYSPKFKKGFPVAWVKISKSYVSYHFMPVYFSPSLCDPLSPGLRRRMQGKSCFNFTSVDPELFAELRDLTVRGFETSRQMGVMG